MIDPVIGGIILGSAIRQYRIRNKFKRASTITAKAVEQVAEAEVRYAEHEQLTVAAANKLKTRVAGIINDTLMTKYYNIFKPYEGPSGKIRKTLMQDIIAIETFDNLEAIRRLENIPKVKQLPGHQKLSGSSAVVSYILFGKMSEANRQLDTASTQSEKAQLLSAHIDTICAILDMQCESYNRVASTLGALNAALLVSIQKYSEYSRNLAPLLNDDGRFRGDITNNDIDRCLTAQGIEQQKICINIAKTLSAIMKTPIFNENAEIQAEAEKILADGQLALEKIKELERRRN